MKKENLLIVCIIALILLNIGTLGFLWNDARRHGGPPPPGPDRMIIEKLKLNDDQQRQFENIKRNHRDRMDQLDDQHLSILRNYFELTSMDSIHLSRKESLETLIGQIHRERARITFRHFEDIKNICNAEQKIYFEALIPDLIQIITPPPRKRRD